jgi:penicillin amidase
LQISGLSAPVTVTRDGHGVPTIEAATLEDLFFAQGYVTAQDRLWQMDVMRRFGGGELSEILGEDLLKLDREQRILGLRAAAKKSLEISSPRDRGFYEAYARGVNAFIGAHGSKLPIEFRILGYEPKPWLPEDSVVVANSMVKDLNYHYFYDALAHEKILAKLGPELTADLFVNRSWHDRPPTVMREDLNEPDTNKGDSEEDDEDDSPDNSVTQVSRPIVARGALPTEGLPVNGSNDWVVSGAHTVTGRQAAALERYAPWPSNAEPVVRSAPALGLSRRCRSNAARDALRDRGPQPTNRVGFHQRRANRDRCLH